MRTGLGSDSTNSAWLARICGQLSISRPTKCDLTSGLDFTNPFLSFEKQPSATTVRAPYNSFSIHTIKDISSWQSGPNSLKYSWHLQWCLEVLSHKPAKVNPVRYTRQPMTLSKLSLSTTVMVKRQKRSLVIKCHQQLDICYSGLTTPVVWWAGLSTRR